MYTNAVERACSAQVDSGSVCLAACQLAMQPGGHGRDRRAGRRTIAPRAIPLVRRPPDPSPVRPRPVGRMH